MSESDARSELRTCPFLVPVVADRLWVYPVGAYCRRPDGRVRVPATQTMGRFCTSASYAECDRYPGSGSAAAEAGALGQPCHE